MPADVLPARILIYPHPDLRARCAPVAEFGDAMALLAERMLELMKLHQGVGLAGPQVGVCQRLFVCNPSGRPEDDQVFVNPEFADLMGAAEGEEGCLSLPEVRVTVRRAKRCRIKAFDVMGQPIEAEAEDLLARIWQHETDHLDGNLIIDRMNPTDRIANKKLIETMEREFRKG